MSILIDYLKITIRGLWKFRVQNFVSVLGLSFGLLLSIIALYWLKYEIYYDTQIKNSDFIYQLACKNTGENRFVINTFQYQILDELYQNIPEIEMHCYGYRNSHLYVIEENPSNEVMADLLQVNVSFFSLLDIPFIEGEIPEHFDPNTNVVILTQGVAMKMFGRTDVLNERVKDNSDGGTYQIIGVVKDNPSNSNIKFGALVPMDKFRRGDYYSYVLLDKKASKQKVLLKLNEEALKRELKPLNLVPLQQSKYLLNGDSFFRAYSSLIVVVISSLFLLLCTFVNFYVITLTKFIQRVRECVFHRQAGARSVHIYGLFYMEILILLMLSCAFCFILIEFLSAPFYNLTNIPLSGSGFYIFAMQIGLIFYLFVLLTQYFLVRYIACLSMFRNVSKRPFVAKMNRNILFVQLVILGIFILALTVVYLQFRYMLQTPTGLDTDNMIFVDLRFDRTLKQNSSALINDLKGGAMIIDAISQRLVIFDDKEQAMSAEYLNGLDGINRNAQIVNESVSKETAPFFGFKIQSGRFIEHDQNPMEAMVNEEAVKRLGLIDPVGKIFEMSGNSYVIVGVVKNYISKPLSSPVSPFIYTPYTSFEYYTPFTAYVKYQPLMRTEALKFVDEVCRSYSQNYDVKNVLKPMDTYIQSFYKKEMIVLMILSVITTTCFLIMLWGILGVVAYTLKQQRKSIAIRKIAGAKGFGILGMYLKRYTILSLAACFLSILISYNFIKSWLEFYAYRIQLNLSVFLIVFVVISGSVLLISFFLVKKTLAENPANVLKENN